MKKQKNKIKKMPIKKKMFHNYCRPIKRTAFFNRIGSRHK